MPRGLLWTQNFTIYKLFEENINFEGLLQFYLNCHPEAFQEDDKLWGGLFYEFAIIMKKKIPR